MVNRFIVKANADIKGYKNLEEACKSVRDLENLGYNCELWVKTIGLYEEHTYMVYATKCKDEIKHILKSYGLVF